jgi:hypothetical protein
MTEKWRSATKQETEFMLKDMFSKCNFSTGHDPRTGILQSETRNSFNCKYYNKDDDSHDVISGRIDHRSNLLELSKGREECFNYPGKDLQICEAKFYWNCYKTRGPNPWICDVANISPFKIPDK